MTLTKLSVNVNKIALLRNSRTNGLPDVVHLSTLALDAGANGVTVHPRPDQRHVRPHDVEQLAELCRARDCELNIEGNPFHNLLEHCERQRPAQATLVPDDPAALTSDRGWNLVDMGESELRVLSDAVASLRRWGCRVSLFLEPVPTLMPIARQLGADRVELYTQPYAAAPSSQVSDLLARYAGAAALAREAGLGINAGHDLNLSNLPPFVSLIAPDEVSIGHALIADALILGMTETVQQYRDACRSAH